MMVLDSHLGFYSVIPIVLFIHSCYYLFWSYIVAFCRLDVCSLFSVLLHSELFFPLLTQTCVCVPWRYLQADCYLPLPLWTALCPSSCLGSTTLPLLFTTDFRTCTSSCSPWLLLLGWSSLLYYILLLGSLLYHWSVSMVSYIWFSTLTFVTTFAGFWWSHLIPTVWLIVLQVLDGAVGCRPFCWLRCRSLLYLDTDMDMCLYCVHFVFLLCSHCWCGNGYWHYTLLFRHISSLYGRYISLLFYFICCICWMISVLQPLTLWRDDFITVNCCSTFCWSLWTLFIVLLLWSLLPSCYTTFIQPALFIWKYSRLCSWLAQPIAIIVLELLKLVAMPSQPASTAVQYLPQYYVIQLLVVLDTFHLWHCWSTMMIPVGFLLLFIVHIPMQTHCIPITTCFIYSVSILTFIVIIYSHCYSIPIVIVQLFIELHCI